MNICANEYIRSKYSNILNKKIFSQDCFELFWQFSYFVYLFLPKLNNFGQLITILTILEEQ